MIAKKALLFGGAVGLVYLLFATDKARAQNTQDRVIRLAELEIDPAYVDEYKAFLKEEVETSIRVEPGVLTLYSVSVKGHPEKVRLFEMYASQAAYESHIQSPHFRKYKVGTQQMVKSLTLLETDQILLGSKFK
jgi:4-carboxymuconolactone decarboxylase